MCVDELPSVQQCQDMAAAYRLLSAEIREVSEGMLVRLLRLNRMFPNSDLAKVIEQLEALLSQLHERDRRERREPAPLISCFAAEAAGGADGLSR